MIWSRNKSIIQRALEEDIGTGDVTTGALIPRNHLTNAQLVSKEAGVFVGRGVIKKILGKKAQVTFHVDDGDNINEGTILADISGNTHHILTTERTMLNFVRHLSGIATLTRKFVDNVQSNVQNKCIILDTRKTTPGLRVLEKFAVRKGGAQNHRMGLFDQVLIKENHLTIVGDIDRAIKKARKTGRKIIIEVENFKELKDAIAACPDRILLDNMSLKEIKSAVKIADGKIPLEVSGNVTLQNVVQIAMTGVDYISIGALTHSARALDISLRLKNI
jgi:nicotinate-nucleotide pyrophosphorylase (carboxylating)